jgi:hypothetical protein
MGRLIDADLLAESLQDFVDWCRDGRKQGVEFVLDCPLPNSAPVEAIPKAQYDELKANITMMRLDYEARLKADLEAMLIELKNKLIDKSWNIDMYDDDLDFECCYLTDIDEVIQQKINVLKAETEEIC